MAKDWGIKITKPGFNTTTNDPREILLSSKYQMFKYHGAFDTSVVFNPGDISKTTSITHGLGYVPAFIPYVYDSSTTKLYIIPSYPYGVDYAVSVSSWADTQKVYFKYDIHGYTGVPAGWNVREYHATDYYTNRWGDNSSYYIGKYDGASRANGAVRFTNIALSSGTSIASATLILFIDDKVAIPDGKVKWVTYGIDEDNTGSFGDPFGRARTDANTNYSEINAGATNPNSYFPITVTNQVNEIKSRGGWSSGNAMGFTMIENDGSDNDTFIYDFTTAWGGDQGTYLKILLPGTLTVNFRAIVFKDKIHD